MAAITVTVEVAFDGSTFTDISNKITKVKINYGRKKPNEGTFLLASQPSSTTTETTHSLRLTQTVFMVPVHS